MNFVTKFVLTRQFSLNQGARMGEANKDGVVGAMLPGMMGVVLALTLARNQRKPEKSGPPSPPATTPAGTSGTASVASLAGTTGTSMQPKNT